MRHEFQKERATRKFIHDCGGRFVEHRRRVHQTDPMGATEHQLRALLRGAGGGAGGVGPAAHGKAHGDHMFCGRVLFADHAVPDDGDQDDPRGERHPSAVHLTAVHHRD